MINLMFEIFDENNIVPNIILDVGAYDCADSIRFSERWPSAKIYAFEPSQEAIELAKENIKNYDNIKLIECVISDIDGEVDWYQSSNGSLASSSIKKPVEHLKLHPTITFNKRNNIKSIRLDTWIKENDIEVVDLIWCDVNGAEVEFINGAINTLTKTRIFLTEYFNFELYENQMSLTNISIELDKTGLTLFAYKGNNCLFYNKNPLP